MKIGIVIFFVLALISCQPEPEFTIDGIGYYTRLKCVKEKTETVWEYHYGFNPMRGRYNYHYGPHTTSRCLEFKMDTIAIK